MQFLVGSWAGEGGGAPGQGSGSFSFTPDLQGKILLRKSFAEYPAANGNPAARHDDLMVVYRDGPSRRLRAIYFDSEDHTIEYDIKAVGGAQEGHIAADSQSKDQHKHRLPSRRAPTRMKMRGGAGGPAGKPAFRRGLQLKTSPPGGRLAARSAARSGCQEWRPHAGASTVYAYFRKNTGSKACATRLAACLSRSCAIRHTGPAPAQSPSPGSRTWHAATRSLWRPP